MKNRFYAISIVLIVFGGVLLWPSISNPAFTKFALGMVRGDNVENYYYELNSDGGEYRSWESILGLVERSFPSPAYTADLPGPFGSTDALFETISRGLGECSTWTEGLMVLCTQENLTCREWALMPEPKSGSSGHALVDIWIPDEERWGMIDVYLGFWVRDDDGRPMSAPRFEREALRSGFPDIEDLTGRTADVKLAESYYTNPLSRLAEIRNNNPVALMTHWTRNVEQINKPVGQFLQWFLGIGPQYVVTAAHPGHQIESELLTYRRKTIGGLSCIGLGGAALILTTLVAGRPRGGGGTPS